MSAESIVSIVTSVAGLLVSVSILYGVVKSQDKVSNIKLVIDETHQIVNSQRTEMLKVQSQMQMRIEELLKVVASKEGHESGVADEKEDSKNG